MRGVFWNQQFQPSRSFSDLSENPLSATVGERLRGNRTRATGLIGSEREICLWEGLWEGGFSKVFRGSQTFFLTFSEVFRGFWRFSEVFRGFQRFFKGPLRAPFSSQLPLTQRAHELKKIDRGLRGWKFRAIDGGLTFPIEPFSVHHEGPVNGNTGIEIFNPTGNRNIYHHHHPESKKRNSSEANSGSIHPYGRYGNAVKTRKTMSTIEILWPVKAIFEKRAATVEVDTLISPESWLEMFRSQGPLAIVLPLSATNVGRTPRGSCNRTRLLEGFLEGSLPAGAS